ncbi:hypothetical protein P692DRAFT_20119286 [Suillus brevipes Sb2]|nr:hypothetical protein P692DRAFT_20119286 [Suillus brevipes Sb2]
MLVSRLQDSCVDKVIREVCIKYCIGLLSRLFLPQHRHGSRRSSHSCELTFDPRLCDCSCSQTQKLWCFDQIVSLGWHKHQRIRCASTAHSSSHRVDLQKE